MSSTTFADGRRILQDRDSTDDLTSCQGAVASCGAARAAEMRILIHMAEHPPTVGDEGLDALNRQFYSADPAAYFGSRWNLLMISACRSEDLDRMLVDGIEFEGLWTRSEAADRTDEDRRLHGAFLMAESQSLHHHVAEALIRLFLAHSDQPACPWIEVARLRRFDLFKSRAAELASSTWPAGLEDSIGPIFAGSDATIAADPSAKTAAIRLLRMLASSVVDDAYLYNSVKHGMAVIPGETSLSLIDEQSGQAVLSTQGASVAFLESEVIGTERVWHETTRWVSVRQTLWFTQLAIREVAALWSVARMRYTGDRGKGGVELVTTEAIDMGLSGKFREAHTGTRFRRVVAHEPVN